MKINLQRHLHFTLLATLALCLFLGWAELYRALQYLNLLFLLYLFRQRPPLNPRLMFFLLAPTALLLVLDNMATMEITVAKPIRHFWIATAIAISICLLDETNRKLASAAMPRIILWFAAAYIAVQITFLLAFDAPFAATENPHYLAYYCGLLVVMLATSFSLHSLTERVAALLCTLVLLALVAYSQSGPAALALLVALLMVGLLRSDGVFPQRLWIVHSVLLLGVVAMVFVGFERIADSWQSLTNSVMQDQRLIIWQDAWRMQLDSTRVQWLIGHGVQSFVSDFTSYSHFHGQADFHSPHSSVLEVLYAFGVAGLCCLIAAYTLIIRSLYRGLQGAQRHWIVLIASIVSYNYVVISLTMPLNTHFNLYTVAYCCGALYCLQSRQTQSNTDVSSKSESYAST